MAHEDTAIERMGATLEPPDRSIASSVQIADLISAVNTTAGSLKEFIREQRETNKTMATGIVSAQTGIWKVLGGLTVIILALWAGQYAFILVQMGGQISPLKDEMISNTLAISVLQTQGAEQRQKNVEVSTQVGCLEGVREYERAVIEWRQEMDEMGAIKMPPGIAPPLILYHPLCQPLAPILNK